MMELVYNDVIVKICCRFGGKLLRIEGLDGNKQMVNGGINIRMVLILKMILKQFQDKHITLMEMVIW